jgi:uncharacterized protein YbjT (DUF2867 family)
LVRRSEKKHTILITGATGNIGKEVIKQLSARADPDILVKAAVRSPNESINVQTRNVELVEANYDNRQSLDSAMSDIDNLFVLTPTHPKLVEFTSNLVNAATKRSTGGPIKHIVKLSHIRADAEPKIEITRLHREAEKIIEESGIPFTFLRPNFFMQNFLVYGQRINDQIAFYVPAGDGKVSFVDVRDIAAVAVKALTVNSDQHVGKMYDLTGPSSLTYQQAVEILSKESQKKMSYTNISDDAAREAMKKLGMADWHINVVIELFNFSRAGYLSAISPVVEDVTGKNPISISQFGRDYADSFK